LNVLVAQLISALGHWLPDPEQAQFCPLGAGSSFSGAGLWRVEHGGRIYVLRRWPKSLAKGRHVTRICHLQRHLAEAGLPVASPLPLLDFPDSFEFTKISIDRDVATWTLSPWLPGAADYWTASRPAKLRAALRTLAELHQAAASYLASDRSGGPRTAPSPALIQRSDRLEELKSGEWADLNVLLARAEPSPERSAAAEALELMRRSLGPLWDEALPWRNEPLPLQWVLRDVWHDHVLFAEDRVTGVLDFGAAAVDSTAGDIARLLGSLVADDRAGWAAGLEAYEQVRPLSPVERAAIPFFDASGTLLSAFNWVHWLYRDPAPLGPNVDRAAAHRRLQRLINRLRHFPT
jgi:Ser/Thr protein kinase RdoA (MazF antagonist)